jgi:hypothetical protein
MLPARETLKACRMKVLSTAARFDRAFFADLADYLVVAVAVMLPWSTTITAICIVAWLVVWLPILLMLLLTLSPGTLRRDFLVPAGVLPAVLFVLGLAGMFWADVSWTERLGGLDGFARLLAIPLLLAQFRRGARGECVIYGFLISASVVLIVSLISAWRAAPVVSGKLVGIPAHDDIFQNTEFLLCSFGLFGVAFDQLRRRAKWTSLLCFLLGLAFLIDIATVVFSRIALAVIPVLVVLLGWRLLHWRGVFAACALVAALAVLAWLAVPNIRSRFDSSLQEMQSYQLSDATTSVGMHAAFLKESLTIVAAAPILGHGTGSIPQQFRQVTAGESGASGVATVNPHNQTFAVTIQLGVVGALILWAMWLAHLLLFRAEGIAAWFGTVVVVENVISSLFHSHLFDFSNGWLYVFGVGVLGGTVLGQRDVDDIAPAA